MTGAVGSGQPGAGFETLRMDPETGDIAVFALTPSGFLQVEADALDLQSALSNMSIDVGAEQPEGDGSLGRTDLEEAAEQFIRNYERSYM